MKTLHLSILTIAGIAIIAMTAVGIFIGKLNENQQQPYTKIAIKGLKENYTTNNPITFYVEIDGMVQVVVIFTL